MKRLKYGLLAAAMVASSAAFIPASADAATEGWVVTDKGRWYQYADGSYAKNEFIGGYWINSAGWVDDTTTYSWQKFTVGKTEDARFAWQFGNTKWLAGLTKEKNQWWKIDGYWYYFHANGFMAQNEFVGKYYVDEQGAWDPDVRGAWEKQADGTWKFKKTTTDAEEYVTGWVVISGFDYHFQDDGTLDTWKVIVDDIDGNGVITEPGEVFALGANGHLGRYTEFDIDDTWPIEYDMTFSFSSVADAKKGMNEIKNFLLGAYYKSGQKPGDVKAFDVDINDYNRDIVIGLVEKRTGIEDSVTDNEDGTVTYTPASTKITYTPNVCIELRDDELLTLLLEDYDGSFAFAYYDEEGELTYDAKKAAQIEIAEGVTIPDIAYTAIPVNNYASYFLDKNNVKSISVCLEDTLENILYKWAGFKASTTVDLDVQIVAEDADVKISHFGMSSNYFVMNVDGKNYSAYYDVVSRKDVNDDDEEVVVYDIYLFFLSNVSQTLGRKLYDAGLVDGYWVYNCLTEEYVSSITNPDTGETSTGYVSYWLEDEYAKKAATSTNE